MIFEKQKIKIFLLSENEMKNSIIRKVFFFIYSLN